MAYKIVALLLTICPLIQADDTDIGKFGHIVSNLTDHKVHVHMDVINKADKEAWIDAGGVWKTGETGKVRKWEVRDNASGMWVANVKPAEDGGKYQILFIEPGVDNGKYKGNKHFTRKEVQSRYEYELGRLHDTF